MQTGLSLADLAAETTRQAASKRDVVVDTRDLEVLPMMHGDDGFALGIPTQISTGITTEHRQVRPLALRQMTDRVGIPAKYAERMQTEAPDLFCQNVNHWFVEKPERRMVRQLDGNVRAFLSDRYQRIDNVDIAQVVLPILAEEIREHGVTVRSTQVTEKRMYIQAIAPRLEAEVRRGDVVQAGIIISNSEVGLGSVTIAPMIWRLICLNGMILPDDRFRKHHVGGRVEMGDEVVKVLSDEALKADDHAILLKVRDVLRAVLQQGVFDARVAALRASTERKLEGNPAKAVEVLGSTVGLTQCEQGDVLRHLIEGGDLSAWGVANSVTRLAHDVESYDRAVELEAVGARVIDLGRDEWKAIAKAA